MRFLMRFLVRLLVGLLAPLLVQFLFRLLERFLVRSFGRVPMRSLVGLPARLRMRLIVIFLMTFNLWLNFL